MDAVVTGHVPTQCVLVKRDTKDLVVKIVRPVQWESMEKSVVFMGHVIVEFVVVKKDTRVNHV